MRRRTSRKKRGGYRKVKRTYYIQRGGTRL
jgi:hypothetical protein